MDIKHSRITANEAPGDDACGRIWRRAVEKTVCDLDGHYDGDALGFAELGFLENHGAGLLDRMVEEPLARELCVLELIQRQTITFGLAVELAVILAFASGYLPWDWLAIATVVGAWATFSFIILALHATAGTVRGVQSAVQELSCSLYRARGFEEGSMGPRLEAMLLRLYVGVLSHLIHSVCFLRKHPRVLVHCVAWNRFWAQGQRVLREHRTLFAAAEIEWRAASIHHLIPPQREIPQREADNFCRMMGDSLCNAVPSTLSPRFHGREDAISTIERVLKPGWESAALRSLVLFGTGGVGKTQIALRYASLHRSRYQISLWVNANTTATVNESLEEISRRLGLLDVKTEDQATHRVALEVKDWLTHTDSRWLLIVDGADDLDILQEFWPANSRGSVLITTRDHTGAHRENLAQDSFHVRPFDALSGAQFLLKSLRTSPAEAGTAVEDLELAKAISLRFGGHPHALNRVAGFISQKRVSIHEFLDMYRRNAEELDGTKLRITGGYDHSLASVWEGTFSRLSGESGSLLNMLAYFDPEGVEEKVLVRGAWFVHRKWDFLKDDIGMTDAQEDLLREGMIFVDQESRVISVHRLVQEATIRHQSDEEKELFFEMAARLFNEWSICASGLRHVQHMRQLRRGTAMPRGDPKVVGELLLRASWYLYEIERLSDAQAMAGDALQMLSKEPESLAYASCLELCGLVDLDLGSLEKALGLFRRALATRKQLLANQEDALIGLSYCAIGRALTELGHLDEAHTALTEAIRIRSLDHSVDGQLPYVPRRRRQEAAGSRVGDSYSKMASLLLRMGKADEAEAALRRCPALANFTEDSFLRGENPRLYGDMVLLSRIRMAQGRVDSALWLASCALSYRRKTLGPCLKTLDSGYDVVKLMMAQGNYATALELGEELEKAARNLPVVEGTGQRARVYYKMAVIHEQCGKATEARKCREMAESLRADASPDLVGVPFSEEEFDKLRPWMLW